MANIFTATMSGTETTGQRGVSRSRAALDRLRRLRAAVGTVLRATAFWLAVVLPAVYLPLLLVESAWALSLVTAMLAVHILAVLAGSEYEPGSLIQR